MMVHRACICPVISEFLPVGKRRAGDKMYYSCFFTCIQISQEVCQVVCYFRIFKNFPQFFMIHTVKVFGIVNKAEVNVSLDLSCFFNDPMDVGNLISDSSAFSKSSLYIWKLSVHVLLKPSLKDFEHYLANKRNECNCMVV